MRSCRLTPRALKDLDQIADFTLATSGERQSEKYLSDMAKRFDRRGKIPAAGRLGEDIGEGYLSYRQGSHIIFCIIDGDIVAIIGVPHGLMDVDAFFQSPASAAKKGPGSASANCGDTAGSIHSSPSLMTRRCGWSSPNT